jgi:2-C-methyl-D-erythritol 4-phosphate cytidylyltransferase
MNLHVIIVAGGSGTRLGSPVPKQFLELAGKPVLMHTIERFRDYDPVIKIITVIPGNHLASWKDLVEKYSFTIPHLIVKGGMSRFHSVKNGLEHVEGPGIVAIHDGVRPLVSIGTIRRCFDTARELGNAVPVIPSPDSLRMIDADGKSVVIDRQQVMQVQTPQVFETGIIRSAYRQEYAAGFTDDATVIERKGTRINLVEGNRENIKITNPGDLQIAAALLPGILSCRQ